MIKSRCVRYTKAAPQKNTLSFNYVQMGALINPINQNSKRLSIPDLIFVDVFTAIYFVLPAKHSNERAVLIHAAGVRQR